ncbi:MAG: aminotransferase class V-fold PLP-dependent enzyme [Chloroflexota bacterium]|nr:aminotransferase class V-fold PLP-dependent enzyme [Chloroflexota bacterium]
MRRGTLRSEFLLRPEVIFLNHGSFGACPRPVFEEYQRWQLELERQPVAFFSGRTRLLPAARAALAAHVGCDRDDLVFLPNATTGISAVARSLPLEPGDEVLATDHEYGACDRAWEFACRGRGARYVKATVPVPLVTPEDVMAALFDAVTQRTRILFVSHITSPTAVIYPVREIARRAHEAGILTVVDGAHAPGQIDLDLRELDADFYAGNCHKWLCAPKGSGFLYARRSVQHLLAPPITSWGRAVDPAAPNAFVDEFEWQGTRDLAAYLAVPAAIDYLAVRDWPRIRQRCHELATWTRDAVTALTGLEPLTLASDAWYAQMVAMPLPPCDAVALKRRLLDEHSIEIPIVTWDGRQLVRVSVQGYNTHADVAALVDALARLLPQERTDSSRS